MNRRIALLLATVLALLLTDGRLAVAQSWPQKPIMLIVPFASGGGTDAFARPLAMQLDQLGVRVLIDNRAGGGGTVGAAAAA